MNHFDSIPDELVLVIADNIDICVTLAAICGRFRRILSGKTYPMTAPWWIPATFENTRTAAAVYKAGGGAGFCRVPLSPAYINRTAPKTVWGRLTVPVPVPRTHRAELTGNFQAKMFRAERTDNISIRNFNAIYDDLKNVDYAAFSSYAR